MKQGEKDLKNLNFLPLLTQMKPRPKSFTKNTDLNLLVMNPARITTHCTGKRFYKNGMRSKSNLNEGFIGLIALLIGVAIIVFFIVRTDIFTGQSGDKSSIEQGQDAIQKAKDVRNMVEQNDRNSVFE